MEYRLYLILAPLGALILLYAMKRVMRHRSDPAARALLAYLATALLLLANNCAELLADDASWTRLFAVLGYLPTLLLPVTWAWFCLAYTGFSGYLGRTQLVACVLVSLAGFGLVATNDLHGLVWNTITFPRVGGYVVARVLEYGPVFWVLAAYTYLLLGGGTVFVLYSILSGRKLYRRQSLWMVAGVVLPGVFNFIYVSRLLSFFRKDYTPLAFAFSGLLFTTGMRLHRLLRVRPMARSLVLNELGSAVVVLDRDRRLIDANAQAQRLLGLDDTSIGVPVADLPTAAFLASVDQTGPAEAAGEHLVRVGERSLSVRIKKTGRAGFRSASYVATVDDVTETIRMQEALEQVRARMISQDRLASLGLIAAGVAHEINNPLGYVWSDVRSLRSTVEGWSEGGTPDLAVVSAILASCEEGLGRISSVVQQLLSYARHGVEGQDAAEPFDLNAGIRSTLVLCRSEYKNAARIVLHLGDVPPLQARRNEINQVVLNIVTNAARAISRGRGGGTRLGTIRITTGHEDGEAYCLIENDGPPIPADVAGRIFEPFFSTAGPGEGMGLGLSVSKEIVEKRHHGGLRLISTDPVAFRVSLPTGERAATP